MSELDIYGPHIGGGRLAVDVGASHGEFALEFAKTYDEVIAYEPLDGARQVIGARIFPDNVEVRPSAAWNSCGKITLYAHSWDKLTGIHRKHPQWDSVSDKPFDVKAVTLDSDLRGQAPDLVKIDTEGAEVEVLEGAMGTIEKFKPKLMIEVHEEGAGKIIQDMLSGFSYVWKTWPSSGKSPVHLEIKHMVGFA